MNSLLQHHASKWKFIITKYLGRSVGKKWRKLMVDIKAVDISIKTAYLYDIGPPVGHKLQALVIELHAESLIENYLNVVKVGMDCLIVNPESLKAVKASFVNTQFESYETKFVDITSGSDSIIINNETIRTELHEAVTNIARNLVFDRVNLLSLSDSVCCNRTSLFGLLLGYPVVYWFDESKNKQQNYLSMVPLCCVQVTAAMMEDYSDQNCETESHHLYSFSYPSCHNDILQAVVRKWFEQLEMKVSDTLFENLSIISVEKCFEAVCL